MFKSSNCQIFKLSNLIIVALFLCACSRQIHTDLESEQLNGQVRYVRILTAPAENAAEQYLYSSERFTEEFFFNKKGLIDSTTFKVDDGMVQKCYYQHDKTGNKTAINHIIGGELVERTEYEYDQNGNMTKWNVIGDNDELSFYALYDCDSLGRTTQARFYDGLGRHLRTELSLYGSNGLIEREISLYGAGDTISTLFSYNDRDQLIEKSSKNSNGIFEATYKYEYDSLNNCIFDIMIDEREENIRRFDYIYDNHNNWIHKQAYRVDSFGVEYPLTEWKREIEYY